jgi:hypothetical protein
MALTDWHSRREVIAAGFAAMAALGGLTMPANALTNPNLGNITAGDVTRLKNAADIFDQVIPVWSQDARYSGNLDGLTSTRDQMRVYAQMISDYLAVQGT